MHGLCTPSTHWTLQVWSLSASRWRGEKVYFRDKEFTYFFFYFSLYLKSSKLVQGLLTLVIGTSCLSMTGLRGQKGRKLFQLCLLNLENQFMVNTKHSMGKIWACLGHSGRKSALDKWLNETWWTDGHRINDNRTNKHHCRALEL